MVGVCADGVCADGVCGCSRLRDVWLVRVSLDGLDGVAVWNVWRFGLCGGLDCVAATNLSVVIGRRRDVTTQPTIAATR